MTNRKGRPDPATLCNAHVYAGTVTFANAFDTEPTLEAAQARIATDRPCVQEAAYRVDERCACREHMCVLLDESADAWDGHIVAVERLTVTTVH